MLPGVHLQKAGRQKVLQKQPAHAHECWRAGACLDAPRFSVYTQQGMGLRAISKSREKFCQRTAFLAGLKVKAIVFCRDSAETP